MSVKKYELDFNGTKIVVETGHLAQQANGSVVVRYGKTVILATACMGHSITNFDFFPLTVIFEDNLYATGRIPGSFMRRESKPGEYSILSARIIDRMIRPLFPESFRNDVQVVITPLSVSANDDIRTAAALATSLALNISDIPFKGPLAAVRVISKDSKTFSTKIDDEVQDAQLDVVAAGLKDSINMIETTAKQIAEDVIVKAFAFAQKEINKLVTFQKQIIKEVGKPDAEYEKCEVKPEIFDNIKEFFFTKIKKVVTTQGKAELSSALKEVKTQIKQRYELSFIELDDDGKKHLEWQLSVALEKLMEAAVVEYVFESNNRVDGRKFDEIRPLSAEIDFLPESHGSGIFQRGETQVLSIVTLGSLSDAQLIDDIMQNDKKRFLLHYNFPPFSTGEARRMGAPTRREIGHGALGEKALLQVIPNEIDFPYTIRVVSDVLSSNGSTSQASICAASLALQAAGVPIKAPVAGIAIGLLTNPKNRKDYKLLTDIKGFEDHFGEMDFKVAGTETGVCAIQMDIKLDGVSLQILEEALNKAKIARLQILKLLKETIPQPRTKVQENAPKIRVVNIHPDKVRDVIGPGGKVINNIISECGGVSIDTDSDGKIVIYHQNLDSVNQAAEMIKDIVTPLLVGDSYNGKVTRVEKYGAFVQLSNGTIGLLRTRDSENEINKFEIEKLIIGDKVKVKISNIDKDNRIKVSYMAKIS